MIVYVLLLIQIAIIYVTTKKVTHHIFNFLNSITKSVPVSSYILALIYFPGTFIHEMSHFIAAVALLLNVHDLDLIPSVKKSDDGRGYYIRLGSVRYEHKDYIRSMLVGIAPIFAGLTFLYLFFASNIFPNESVLINILSIYVLFSVSSSMFSSRKDLEGGLILIPLVLLLISFFIGFKVDVAGILLSERFVDFFWKLNMYVLPASIGNVLLLSSLEIFYKFGIL